MAPSGEVGAGSARRRRGAPLAFLAVGLLVAYYLRTHAPSEQHVRVVLGDQAPEVVLVDLQYLDASGELVRAAHFPYPNGAAPRVISHEPTVPNGDYILTIDVDTRDGRRAIQRRVTLGGGSTQVDVSNALLHESQKP